MLQNNAGCKRDIRKIINIYLPKKLRPNTFIWDPKLNDEDGTGIKVALLDSGLNWWYSNFSGASIQGRDFTGCGGLNDPTGHGTSNASILVSQGDCGLFGMSPAIDLLAAKVLSRRDRNQTIQATARAIRWAVNLGADIIVIPFGTNRAAQKISYEIRKAAQKGCFIFAAAGNRGPEKLCFPASLKDVIAVSALTSKGSIYPNCCAHEKVNLYSLGDSIPAVGYSGITKISGSSPATVIAAGYTALVLAYKRRSL